MGQSFPDRPPGPYPEYPTDQGAWGGAAPTAGMPAYGPYPGQHRSSLPATPQDYPAPQPYPLPPQHTPFASPQQMYAQSSFAHAPVYVMSQQVVVAGSQKSVGAAIVLTFFFGPLGMLYSTVVGALIMFFVNLVSIPLTFGISLWFTWPIQILWAALAASGRNGRSVIQQNAPMGWGPPHR